MSGNFAVQLTILASAFNPVGFVDGYLLSPSLGVDPPVGCALGPIVANAPMSLLVMRRSV